MYINVYIYTFKYPNVSTIDIHLYTYIHLYTCTLRVLTLGCYGLCQYSYSQKRPIYTSKETYTYERTPDSFGFNHVLCQDSYSNSFSSFGSMSSL